MTVRHGSFARAALLLVIVQLVVAGLLAVLPADARKRAEDTDSVNRKVVSALGLSDLALWSAASYCRHPSTADRFAPFADHPSAMEHFPAGSVVPPPEIADRGSSGHESRP